MVADPNVKVRMVFFETLIDWMINLPDAGTYGNKDEFACVAAYVADTLFSLRG